MQQNQDPRTRRPWSIGRLSATHLLVIAYAALLLGFAVVVFVIGKGV